MAGIKKIQLEMISALVYRKFGIYLGEDKYDRLRFKLETLLNRGYCTGIEELCARLSSGDPACFEQLASCVTTCHTFFFRESEHFRILISDIRKNSRVGTLIWCAACSTGEEPYSIAMALLDAGITDFHIIASDVNRVVLSEFNKGVYHESRLAQLPHRIRNRYFRPEGDGWYRIDGKLREYIAIKNLNLMDHVRFVRPFDYVFCRNVFIYFDEKSRTAALDTATANMKTGGLLFIGHAEVLLTQPANLKKTGCSVYCRTD
jgi:chemotaxis protein methyltransferase CheR